jgi:uncharacterized RDD family membrane protein YckC
MREGAVSVGQRRYAGFWIRVVARLIDVIALAIVNFMIQTAVTAGLGLGRDPAAAMGILGVLILVQIAIAAGYEAYFLSTYGATLGKMALGLKVIKADGSGLSFGAALGRYFAQMLSSIILLLGYIMVAFDQEKRGLHDRICDTRVVYK